MRSENIVKGERTPRLGEYLHKTLADMDVCGIFSDIRVRYTAYASKMVRERPTLSPDSGDSLKIATCIINKLPKKPNESLVTRNNKYL